MNPLPRALLGALLAAAALPALAQYKLVGPDGKVTYTDRPPTQAKPLPVENAAPEATLPYALRQPVSRYPVTLYTTAKCAPCDAGRNWLRNRGIPYAEKTISSQAENEALAREVGAADLPALRIGTQPVRGFHAEQWASLFDAAGYPASSQLPHSYRWAAATPLIAPPAAPEASAAAPAPAPALAVEPRPDPANPAGIRF